jgi:hypothetical protein
MKYRGIREAAAITLSENELTSNDQVCNVVA